MSASESEEADEATCPVCGETYDYVREESKNTPTSTLRSDAVRCTSRDGIGNHRTTVHYVHLDGRPPRDDPTPPAPTTTQLIAPPEDIGVGTPGFGEFDHPDLDDLEEVNSE